MEISKENMFNINYTSVLEQKPTKRKRTSKVLKFIKNNKIISIAVIVFFMCVSLNLVLIYNFMRILGGI